MELLLHFVLLVLLVRREGVLLDLPDGDGVKKRAKKSGNCEQDPCTIQITHLVLSLSVLSSPLSWCCRSVLPLLRVLAAGLVQAATSHAATHEQVNHASRGHKPRAIRGETQRTKTDEEPGEVGAP